MPRAGLDAAAVIEAAARMLDDRAPEGLSLAALAERLGVKPPSLYKHVDGMAGLERGIMIRAKSGLAQAIGQAAIGRSGTEAIKRIAHAYRRWALAHPGQYPLTVRPPAPGDEADQQASSSIAVVIFTVLDGFGIRDAEAVDATRFLRSSLHGFVDLETRGAFALPVDLEHSYQRLVEHVATSLSGWSRS
ncbi:MULTISPECIES: TetR-like C-terminal domain-containing protein [Actinoalloteichus]|uniref:Transcriptional regulator, TetR family n=1 Tax=Actinoalloteichus fjordicus TaxID=1612552 RepID=A0AAC9PU84_9PSEU|nr:MULTISPECIES: TetR-like C-terminal domain-containing protein [Actinoalloteichus]APU16686.1 transcriptional regulator, TetR family [Actinoalloteichus fjordicus]APU22752.1 transcriptional regulator, TetR family [Actinoalloteichus sp. GBA129-24]